MIELLIVLGVISCSIGTLVVGMGTAQRRYGHHTSTNVLTSVHLAQYRNARQFGGSGVIYGYTIHCERTAKFDSRGISEGKFWAIWPWVIDGSTSPKTRYIGEGCEILSDMGGGYTFHKLAMPLTGLQKNAICPQDDFTMVSYKLDGTTNSTSLHVAFAPRTGFIRAYSGGTLLSDSVIADLSDPAFNSNAIELLMSNKANGRISQSVIISKTGLLRVNYGQ
jgi:hypothetical protein